MKLTVLTDNNTCTDHFDGCLGEAALCYLIEDEGARFLFDTGYSNVAIRNAEKLGIDLGAVDLVVLSHGHDDHTGGLRSLPFEGRRPRLIAHPRTFDPKRIKERDAGAPFSLGEAKERFDLQLTREPMQVSPTVTFLGEVPRRTDFEGAPLGESLRDGEWRPDDLPDDSALACRTPEGLVVVTGCSHSGICNIIEHAKDVMKEPRIRAVIGGFHLRARGPQLDRTVEYFAGLEPQPDLYPCHCTCFDAKRALAERLPIHEVGSGLSFEW